MENIQRVRKRNPVFLFFPSLSFSLTLCLTLDRYQSEQRLQLYPAKTIFLSPGTLIFIFLPLISPIKTQDQYVTPNLPLSLFASHCTTHFDSGSSHQDRDGQQRPETDFCPPGPESRVTGTSAEICRLWRRRGFADRGRGGEGAHVSRGCGHVHTCGTGGKGDGVDGGGGGRIAAGRRSGHTPGDVPRDHRCGGWARIGHAGDGEMSGCNGGGVGDGGVDGDSHGEAEVLAKSQGG